MIRDDPTIAAIREARHRISMAYKHDPRLLIAYYQQLQESYRDRFIPAGEPMNGRSGTVTYPVPARVDHVLAENKLEGFGAAQEPAETD